MPQSHPTSSSNDFPAVELSDTSPEATVRALVERAIELQASDLYLMTNEASVDIQVRHLGIVRPLNRFSLEVGKRLISYVKAMSEMDIADHRRPGNGRWLFNRSEEHRLDLRVNAMPTQFGEDLDLRLLDRRTSFRDLSQLGLWPAEQESLVALLEKPSGLILVSGPTGCGKTTTLYACLQHLNNGKRKINTLEDPIEYTMEGVRQSQVNHKLGVDFPELMANVLRQSPDVIMIGEIRDQVTAQIAVRAANSGLLVLATVHAPLAAAAVQSMRALNVLSHFLGTSLLGVVSQRLVRELCEACKRPAESIQNAQLQEELRPWLEKGQRIQAFISQGCAACHHTGYVRRSGVFEVLCVSPEIRHIIYDGQPVHRIERQALEDGLIDLRHAALYRVLEGKTSMEEVHRTVPFELIDHDSH